MSFELMQEKSYYALRLPHGWWLFGLDLALVDDIDMCQCRRAGFPIDSLCGICLHSHTCQEKLVQAVACTCIAVDMQGLCKM